jgi:hypothetical protein
VSTVAGTTPYPWPYDGVVDPARLALVVAGHDRRWSGRTPDPEATAERVDALGEALLAAGALVVRAAHRPAREAPGPAPGLLAGDPRVAVVHAAGTDAFYGSDLDALLRGAGRDHLLLAGFGLEGPVHSTLRSANDRGYECLLLADACAPLDPALAPAARSMVEMSGGIFGAVGSTAALLAALPTRPPAPSSEDPS